MASVVTLCNLALSHLGDRATLTSIDPPEGSAQADHCANFWPVARDTALAARDWRFASTTQTLAQYDDTLQDNPAWRYAYTLPADFLAAREFVFTDSAVLPLEPGSPHFDMGTLADTRRALYANHENLALRYTRRVLDPTQYPPGFATAVSYLLASYLAGPIIKGRAGVGTADAMWKRWELELAKAAQTDANQQRRDTSFKPSGVRARGYTGRASTIEDGSYRRELPYWAQT